MIVPGGFLNSQRVPAPHRNIKIVLLTCIVLVIRHRHLPPYINSWCRDGSFQTLRFSVLRSFPYLLKPVKGEPETETGNRPTKTRFLLAAVIFGILVFLACVISIFGLITNKVNYLYIGYNDCLKIANDNSETRFVLICSTSHSPANLGS